MKTIIILLTGMLICSVSYGQVDSHQGEVGYPSEFIQVHLSETSLFPGHVIGIKIYCTNPLFPELELSRVAFIELLNDRNVPILRRKILLENGTGEGEFVLPTNLGSGLYTLLTYTNWLKNFGEKSFHSQRIVIINPDQGLPQVSDTSDCPGIQSPGKGIKTGTHSGLIVKSDKERYATREKVSITLSMPGQFSVSVCQTEPVMQGLQFDKENQQPEMMPGEMEYLPDFGGIRLSGKLEDASGIVKPGKRIILSEPGPGTHIESTFSDDAGNFHFLLHPQEGETDLVFTLPESDMILKLEEPFWNGYRDPPKYPKLCLKKSAVSFLEEKFSHFQLQEKFNQSSFSIRSHLDLGTSDSSSFHNDYSKQLMMDDYVLLDSLPEYFYELVPNIKFLHSRGSFDIRVSDPESGIPYAEKPGVFVDGVLYSDYTEIAHIPVHKIDRISIFPEVYYHGNFSFGGIIDLHTKDSDFNSIPLLPNMTRIMFPLASGSEMIFESPDHSLPNSSKRIPDFRHLICWEPDVAIGTSGETSIQFYTGDLTGEYTVRVYGLSAEGKLIRSETKIWVDPRIK
jgi:hypothetical protein